MPYKDHEKQLQYVRDWRKRHRDYLREDKKEYRERVKLKKAQEIYNKETLNIRQRHERAKKITGVDEVEWE